MAARVGATALAIGPRSLIVVALGVPGGTFSGATAINDRGQVAGASSTASGELHAVLWTKR